MKVAAKTLPVVIFFLFMRLTAWPQVYGPLEETTGAVAMDVLDKVKPIIYATAFLQDKPAAPLKPGGVHWSINWWYYPAGLLLLMLALVFSLRQRRRRKKGRKEPPDEMP